MEHVLKYPFRLDNAFFISLHFARVPEMPDQIELNLPAQLKVREENYPSRLQIDLKLETEDDSPLSLCLELVALFDLLEGYPEPERSIIPDFVNEQALHMIWPYMTQMVTQVTSQMGMNTQQLQTPYIYTFSPPKPESNYEEEE